VIQGKLNYNLVSAQFNILLQKCGILIIDGLMYLIFLHYSWEPLPNLRSALVGYDLPTGNPYASNFIEDPGLKKQIFNSTVFSG
jgi:hypothetical protein